MSDHRDCGADAAAYVLGALEPTEAEAFREHLTSCVVCRDEVSAFQEVVDVLPMAAPPQPVPAGLKRRVMSEVAAEARGAAAPAASSRRRAGRRGVGTRLGGIMPSPAFAAVAAGVVLALVIGAIALTTGGSATHVYNASVSWPGSAALHVTDGRGELVVHKMPAPPATKVYEVWLQRGDGRPEPTTALFTPTAAGSGAVDVPGSLHGVSRVLVTPEQAGGAAVPTHAPIVIANLS